MTEALSDVEKQVIALIQEDMPIVAKPYAEMAAQMGLAEDQLLEILGSLVDRGIIRRFGATLRHQQSGYKANVMVAWQVDEERIQETGRTMAGFSAVSHCYRRDPTDQWPYNLYTMVHGRNEADCRATVAEMAAAVNATASRATASRTTASRATASRATASGGAAHTLLFSRKELKKTSMKYFSNDVAD